MAWTEDRVAEACRLWQEGWSASLIAEKLGDTTKNSVIGQAYRRGWGQRRPAYARPGTPEGWMRAGSDPKPKPKPKAKPRPHPSPSVPIRPPEPPPPPPKPRKKPGTFTLLDLRSGECKWPCNAPERGGEYLFCGEHQFNGHPYCEYHARLGFSGKGTARKAEVAGWQPRAEGWR